MERALLYYSIAKLLENTIQPYDYLLVLVVKNTLNEIRVLNSSHEAMDIYIGLVIFS